MSGEDDPCPTAVEVAELVERLAYGVGVRLDEARVIMVMADLLHDGRVRADGGPRRLDVLQILTAGGVGPVRACDKRQRPAYALVAHGRELVGEERMPVPVAPEHWQVQT